MLDMRFFSGPELRAGMVGDEVAGLHDDLVLLGFAVPEVERRDRGFGAGTGRAVAAFQAASGLRVSAVVDRATASMLTRAVAGAARAPLRPPNGGSVPPNGGPVLPDGPAPVPFPAPVPDHGSDDDAAPTGVSGRVYFQHGEAAAGVRLRAYRRGFGGTATRLGEETTTAADGGYRIRYDADGVAVNLELRAVRADGKLDREVPLTDTVFAVSGREVLNVVAPISVRPLAAEHRRLLADVDPHLQGLRLGQARQTDDQPDLTLLQETTGWDARLVALAASADRVAVATGVPTTAAYAMLRGGLPDDPVGLAGVTVSAVDRALREAVAAGVVTVTAAERTAALDAFAVFARTTRLAAVAPGALSSQGEMLAAAGLPAAAAATFDEIYQANERDGGGPARLWPAVQAAGLPADELRRTGKLGLLTLNNAALTAELRRDLPGDLRSGLVSGQLYRPEAWVRRLTDAAGGDETALAALLPPAFGDGTVAARLRRYADDLGRKVRVSYPTAVVAD